MSAQGSRGHARRWTPAVVAALAALAFAADAHADDLAPAPTDLIEVEAVVADIQATVETAVGDADLGLVGAPAVPDIAASAESTPVEAPETVAESQAEPGADSQPAAEEAPAPAPVPSPDPEPAVTPEAAEAGDTGQYQQEAEAPPTTESASSDPTGSAPDEWTWIWDWNCADPVEMPTPSGNSWTWIWDWNCDTQTLTSDAISVTQDEQYQSPSDRYQNENTSTFSPTNFNMSIRIFSPGDDGAVTQLNSTVSTVTSLTTTVVQTVDQTVDQTVNQTVDQTVEQTMAVLPLPRDGPLAALPPAILHLVATALPAIGSLGSIAAGPTLLVNAELGGTLDDTEAAVPGGAAGRSGAPSPRARTAGLGDRASRWASSTVSQQAAPSLEAAPVTLRSRPEPRTASRKRHSTPSQIFLPSPVASAGGAAEGGTGGAFAAFLLALTIAYLVVPPSIRGRVRLTEGRLPRGVDLGGDGRPG